MANMKAGSVDLLDRMAQCMVGGFLSALPASELPANLSLSVFADPTLHRMQRIGCYAFLVTSKDVKFGNAVDCALSALVDMQQKVTQEDLDALERILIKKIEDEWAKPSFELVDLNEIAEEIGNADSIGYIPQNHVS